MGGTGDAVELPQHFRETSCLLQGESRMGYSVDGHHQQHRGADQSIRICGTQHRIVEAQISS